jgi:CheY-like chemotaxis protein
MKKSITIIDDDIAVQDLLRIVFEKAGFVTYIFSDAKAVLANAFVVPDIFLLDKQLSGVDGLEICRHLKQLPATKDIPVIMLSATPHIENMAIAAGAEAFVEKPFSNKALVALVNSHLKK